jgi:hypothetical protein
MTKDGPHPASSVLRWCHYCRKDSHHDAECWSTRPVNWSPDGMRTHFSNPDWMRSNRQFQPMSLEDLLIRFGGR